MMKSNFMSEDWLKKWYKENSSNLSSDKMNEDNWEIINKRLKDDVPSFWYKSNMEEMERFPDAGNWDKIRGSITPAAAHNKLAERIYKVASILIIVFLPYLLKDVGYTETFSSNLAKAEKTDIIGIKNSTESVKTDTYFSEENTSPHVKDHNSNLFQENGLANIQENLNSTILSAGLQKVSTENQVEYSNLHKASLDAPIYNTNSIKLNDFIIDPLPVKKIVVQSFHWNELATSSFRSNINKDKTLSKWSFGLSAGPQVSTLQNPTTLIGMDSESRITNKLSYSISFNTQLAYSLSKRSFLVVGLKLNDIKQQRYKDFHEGHYIEKSTRLEYQSLLISYHYSVFKPEKFKNAQFNASAGFHSGYLTNVEEKINGESIVLLSPGFKKLDLGVTAGLNYKYRIFDQTFISTELIYSNGVINTFKGIDRIPGNFYRTFTSSLHFGLGISKKF